MKDEDKFKLTELLKEYQKKLFEKSQDNKYMSCHRSECLDKCKQLLKTLEIIQNG